MKDEFQNKLNKFCNELFSPLSGGVVSDEQLDKFLNETICVLPCGGESKRMSIATDKHKTALNLPDGETVISRTIRFYQSSGIEKFVLLVGVNARSVIESVKPMLECGINIQFSKDPGKPVGRGGAIKNAIEQGFIPSDAYMLIHNADDQIVGYPGDFATDICRAHILTHQAGGLATAIIVLGSAYAFSAMHVSNGKVMEMASNPIVPLPTHVGVTVMSPESQEIFIDRFNYAEKKDFENHLFPILTQEGKLYAFAIPRNCWFPVNNLKEYDNLIKTLKSQT